MGKIGKIILTVAVIFAAFLLATFLIGDDGSGGALKTAINGVIDIVNGWVSTFTANKVSDLIPTMGATP